MRSDSMVPEIPPERFLDLFTRMDNLLLLNLEATRKLTEAVERLAGVIPAAPPPVAPPPVAPPVAPPPRIVVAPAPRELVPLTSRLDSMDAKLGSIDLKLGTVDSNLGTLQASIEEYRKRDLQGKPVTAVDLKDTDQTAWKEVALWRVGDVWGLGKGIIKEVSIDTDNPIQTRFKLTVMGKVLFKDLQIRTQTLTIPFPPHEIPRGEKILLEFRSYTPGTTVTVNGMISGKEFG